MEIEMNEVEKQIVLKYIQNIVAEDPSMLRPIIDAATEGVKTYADNQNDKASKLAYKMVSILEHTSAKHLRCKPFCINDLLEEMRRWFGGTTGLKKLYSKFEVPEPEEPKENT